MLNRAPVSSTVTFSVSVAPQLSPMLQRQDDCCACFGISTNHLACFLEYKSYRRGATQRVISQEHFAISRDERSKDQFGQYPVLYVDFLCVNA